MVLCLAKEQYQSLNAMAAQGESTAMATSSANEPESTPKATLLADQPPPHIFEVLISLQDDLTHLLQITLEQGSKIQEQGVQLRELESLCESLWETQLNKRVGLWAIHNHILPQPKGKEPEGQGRVSFRQTHQEIEPKEVSFGKNDNCPSSNSNSDSTGSNIQIRDFFPRSSTKYATSTPQKKNTTPVVTAPTAATPAPATTPATPAPAATLSIPKLSSPDGYNGKMKWCPARQWMARVLAWMELSRAAFPNEQAVVLYLLHLLTDDAANWAEPHLQKVLEMNQGALATIQEFVEHSYNAFDDPDAERATKRRIHKHSQDTVSSKTSAEYTMEFRNLVADLDSDDVALMATYGRGLHWKVKEILSQKENQPRTLEVLIQNTIQIDNVHQENEASRPPRSNPPTKKVTVTTPAPVTIKWDLKALPNYVDEAKRKRRREAGLCIKCGTSGHTIKDCKVGGNQQKIKRKKGN
jgi:hypothetical protein